MRLAVYTCITGNYDTLSRVFPSQNPSVDFICFTDNPQLEYSSGNWNIKPIPGELLNLPKVKQQRVIKACPHRYLPEYDATLWIDGNISVLCDVVNFLKNYPLGDVWLYTRRHPARKCIYEEAKTVLRMKRDVPGNVNPQIERYRKEGFPKNFGLHETNIIYRSNTDVDAKVFGNMWAKEILDGSHRDQLSFDYCLWRGKYKIGELKVGNLLKDANFRWRRHGK